MVLCKCGGMFKNERGLAMHQKRGCPLDKPDPPVEEADDLGGLKGTEPMSRMDMLRTEAEMQLDRNNHALGEWRVFGGWEENRCILCNRKVAISPAPMQGVQPISGDALTAKCTATA